MKQNFFSKRPDFNPIIYAYTETSSKYDTLIKIGYTTQTIEARMSQHYPTSGPKNIARYNVLLIESAMRDDGTSFKDYEIHKVLENSGFSRVGGEWFRCKIKDVKAAIISVKNRKSFKFSKTLDYKLRPEQKDAIKKTSDYFKSYKSTEKKIPHFLWNCKMRFGKTFTTYKLAEKMKWTKILVLTFKPAVENSWYEDLVNHKDFENWQFLSRNTLSYESIDKKKSFVCFASFQDFLGKNSAGGIKIKNKWAHKINWDCIVLDEYHYGSWRDKARDYYISEIDEEEKEEQKQIEDESGLNSKTQNIWKEEISPLITKNYLYLSGTPFRAISSGEFIEEQIFNWTYSDEQQSKLDWKGEDNPYLSLPKMIMMTYQLPDSLTKITSTGEFDEFDLNTFFKADGVNEKAQFKFQNEVQKWLDLIKGTDFKNIYLNLKLGENKPVLPFEDTRLLSTLTHTLWFLPSVSSCYAMKNLLLNGRNSFYHDYEINVCAGSKAGIGLKALTPVIRSMDPPNKTKTITLSCGKLTTGVTVRPWSGIFMLRNTKSPETYFQTAFRVQSPWTMPLEENVNALKEKILKENCYLFDFAPNRALKLVSDYCIRLNLDDEKKSTEEKVEEFIKFLPILCFNGSTMQSINAEDVLDIGMVGTSGTQLAKKFESTRLINVDNVTLKNLLNDKKALNILMKIEGFRTIQNDLEKIINKTDKINNIKKEIGDKISEKQKKELTQEEKDQRNLRKKIQDKIKIFATRIPVFMYLTEYREETLRDVITKLEPSLFKKVVSLTVEDFEYLTRKGIFNTSEMDSAIFSFKRYEHSSLHYSGFTKYKPREIGLTDTKISIDEFNKL